MEHGERKIIAGKLNGILFLSFHSSKLLKEIYLAPSLESLLVRDHYYPPKFSFEQKIGMILFFYKKKKTEAS